MFRANLECAIEMANFRFNFEIAEDEPEAGVVAHISVDNEGPKSAANHTEGAFVEVFPNECV